MNFPPAAHRLSAKAIIRHPGRRELTLIEHEQFVTLPGGGVEHGEDPLQALRREIAAEMGQDMAEARGSSPR